MEKRNQESNWEYMFIKWQKQATIWTYDSWWKICLQVGALRTLAQFNQLSTKVNITSGQRVLAFRKPIMIARRSIMDVGTTSNNLIPSCVRGNTLVRYDQFMNLQALDATYHTFCLPKDFECHYSYISIHWFCFFTLLTYDWLS